MLGESVTVRSQREAFSRETRKAGEGVREGGNLADAESQRAGVRYSKVVTLHGTGVPTLKSEASIG